MNRFWKLVGNWASLTDPIMLTIKGENLSYGTHVVLRDVDFSLARGERVVLLGRSGSGKSTLLAAIYARLGGRIALVPQEQGLVPQLSVFHNAFMGRLDDHGALYNLRNLIWPRKSDRQAIEQILTELGLEGLSRKSVMALSGGQKQRTALARALYRGGEVLIADEPVSAVDEHHAQKLLARMAQQFETHVMALHDVELAKQFATRIIGIKEGRFLFDAKVSDLRPDQLEALYRV